MQNKTYKNNKRGLTLIELLIAITLIGILSIAFSSIYINSMKTFRTEFVQTRLQTDSQTVLDRMISDIKGASGIETTYSTYTTSGTTIIMKIPAVDSGQNILYSGTVMKIDRVIYYLASGSLHRKLIADSASSRYPLNNQDKIIATGVENLAFTYSPAAPSTNQVSISITLGKYAGKIHRTITVTSKTKLRNFL